MTDHQSHRKVGSTLLRFVVSYAGHPILFLGYLTLIAQGSLGNTGITIAGIESFSEASANVFRMHLGLYVLLTLPIYLFWTFAVANLSALFPSFCYETYQRSIVKGWLLYATPGLINIYIWSVDGMEGNVFGLAFLLPMLGASLGHLVSFSSAIISSFRGTNKPH